MNSGGAPASGDPPPPDPSATVLTPLPAAGTPTAVAPVPGPAAAAPPLAGDGEPAAGEAATALLAQRFSAAVSGYRIVRLLGEGGMGAVFLAEQESPLRPVAIKLIHANLATPELLARFQREGEVLGRLRHPGIAQIFTAGQAQVGGVAMPYLVMEYVEGLPLLAYARSRDLDLRQRLLLFAHVCDAIEHAHQRGIIHRDLKPANILVTGDGQPKVLDFGVARVNDASDMLDSQLTTAGFLVGTLQYMSPEQTVGDSADVDVRSDVYALGVVGYELLARQLPYQLPGRDPFAIVQCIREQAPAPLGTHVPAARGDIEVVFGKALEKQRERRYDGASELAEDIRRCLDFQPIRARPPSLGYRLGRFARRNRALTAALALALLAVVAGVVGVARFAQREMVARQHAEAEMSKARATTGFIKQLLSQANPAMAMGREVTVKDALSTASQSLAASLSGQPTVEIEVRTVLGDALQNLGMTVEANREFDRALALARQHLPARSRERLQAEGAAAVARMAQGEFPEASRRLRDIVQRMRGVFAEDSPEKLTTELALLQAVGVLQPERDLRPALAQVHARMATNPALPPELLTQWQSLQATALRLQGEEAQALALRRQQVEQSRRRLGPLSPETLTAVDNYANALADAGRLPEAIALLRQSVDDHAKVMGAENPETISARNNLAAMLQRQGELAAAQAMFEQALAVSDRHPAGRRHSILLRGNLASLYFSQGDLARSEATARRALQDSAAYYGMDNADTLDIRQTHAVVLTYLGRYAEAEREYRQLLQAVRRRYGNDHLQTFAAESEYAAMLRDAGRADESQARFAALLPRVQRTLGPDHPQTLQTLYQYSGLLLDRGRHAEALAMARQLDARAVAVLGAEHPFALLAPLRVARSLIGLQRFDEARAALDRCQAGLEAVEGISPEWKQWVQDAYRQLPRQ